MSAPSSSAATSSLSTSSAASSSSSSLGQPRRLLESGIFNSSYPHRIQACFQYLSQSADALSYFTLKDLTERGKFVFSNLSIPPSQDTSFAVMDIFRTFDRSGIGRVHVEDFVVGIVQHLLRLSKNEKLIEEMAKELMLQLSPQGITSSILSAMDDSTRPGPAAIPPKLAKCPLFCANLLAVKFRIELNLQRQYHNKGISRANLEATLSESLDEVVAETQIHFHLPTTRLVELVSDDVVYSSHASNQPEQQLNKSITAATKRLQAHPIVWQPEGQPRGTASNPNTPSQRRSIFLSAMPDGLDGQDDELSDDDEREVTRGAGRRASLSRKSIYGGATRRGSVDTLIGYLSDLGLGLPVDGVSAEDAFDRLDADQLFLLQTAYRSLDSFFALVADDQEKEKEQKLKEVGATSGRSEQSSKLRAEGLRLLMSEGGENLDAATSSTLSYGERTHTPSLADSILPPASPTSSSSSGTTLSRQKATQAAQKSGRPMTVEAELSMDLSLALDELRRAKMRIDILQLIQARVTAQIAFQPSSSNSNSNSQGNAYLGEVEASAASPSPAPAGGATQRAAPNERGTSLLRLFPGENEGLDETKEQSMSYDEKTPNKIPAAATSSSSSAVNDAGAAPSVPETAAKVSAAAAPKDTSMLFAPSDASPQPVPTFQDVMAELGDVKALVTSRGADTSALGLLLKMPSAILPVDGPRAVGSTLIELDSLSARLHETLLRLRIDEEAQAGLAEALRKHAEKDAELRQLEELRKPEMATAMETAIELQMCKEDLRRMEVENANAKTVHKTLAAMTVDNKDVKVELAKRQAENDKLREQLRVGGSQHAVLEEMERLRTRLAEMELERERMKKENHRLENAFQTSNERMKKTLLKNQEQQKTIHATEDELEDSKATIGKLTGDIVTLKGQLSHMNELERSKRLLERTIESRTKDLEASKEEGKLVMKLKTDLRQSYDRIVSLEQTLNTLSIEVSQAETHAKSLAEERDTNRKLKRELLDLKTDKVTLEEKLKDLEKMEHTFHDAVAENNELKMRAEKAQGLMAMVARLKASSRASVYALREQDRVVETLRAGEKSTKMELNAVRSALEQKRDDDVKMRERLEEIEPEIIQLRGENAKLKDELVRYRDDLRSSNTRWKKLRTVVTNHPIDTSVQQDSTGNLAKVAKALRKSLSEEGAANHDM